MLERREEEVYHGEKDLLYMITKLNFNIDPKEEKLNMNIE